MNSLSPEALAFVREYSELCKKHGMDLQSVDNSLMIVDLIQEKFLLINQLSYVEDCTTFSDWRRGEQ